MYSSVNKWSNSIDRPDVTVPVIKSRLDKFKTNIRNGKYFELCEVIYIIHVIEYQYHGLPRAHMVFRVDSAHDIDADKQEDIINFVDRNFIAVLCRFEGEEFQNIHWWDNKNELTDDYKAKALEIVCKHNLHNCAVTINGFQKDISDRCRRGYRVVRKQSIKLMWIN
jgi:hypothetical protein